MTTELAVVSNANERIFVMPVDVPRWSSGQSNFETVFDASNGRGHCRWCGGEMSVHYPKEGRALTHRCCSLVCQILYAVKLGYFELPLKNDGSINLAAGRRQLSELGDVVLHGNVFPGWREKAGAVGSLRMCKYTAHGRHNLPHGARANQDYCGPECRSAAFRSKTQIVQAA